MIICPGCGADMHFSPGKQVLKCDYCETEVFPEDYAGEEGLKTKDSEFYDTMIFSCPQCGGEVMNTEETAAAFCSYCGASVQLASRMSSEKRPAGIIPFAIDTKKCSEIFKKKIKQAVFAPSYIRKGLTVEQFRGIYMPYWSYGFSIDQNIKENAEHSYREGDYDVTDYYSIEADCNGEYDGIAYDSASNFDDEISESISPFNARDIKEFNTAYLSGFYADRGDVSKDLYVDEAVSVVKEDVAGKFLALPEFAGLGTDRHGTQDKIHAGNPKTSFVLYPVWFLTNRFGNDRIMYTVVNGQTGKLAADIPIDPIKYIIISLITAIPVFFLLSLLPAMEPFKLMCAVLILHVICTIIAFSQACDISKRETHENDRGYKSMHGDMKADKKYELKLYKYIYHIAVLVAGGVMLFNTHRSDYEYYICCAAVTAGVAFTFVGIIRQHNILSTHRPPQLEKRD